MGNDSLSRDQLIVKYYPMVQRIAAKMAAKYPTSVDMGDLVGIGTMGLIDAAERFDPEKNTSFSSYALIRIKGAIVDGLRKQDWVPRSVRSKQRELNLAENAARNSGEKDSAAIARLMDVDEDTLRKLRKNNRVITQVSMWESRGGGEQSVADSLRSDDATPADVMDRLDIARQVQAALSRLPERDQTIARMHYYENRTFKEIGELLGVTESRISQLHSRFKKRLLESFQESASEDDS